MSKRIEVVFTKNLENVAKIGEKKMVSGGFWRNYLLPKGLALPSTTKVARKLASDREKTLEKEKPAAPAVVAPPTPTKKIVRQAKKQEKKVKERRKSAKLKQRVKEK